MDMKRARNSALVLALAAVGVAAAAAVAPEGARAPVATTAPLKGEIRVSPGKLRAMGAMPITLEGLNQKISEFSRAAGSYEHGVSARSAIAKQCASKAYSVQDQMAVGCTGTDTLDQCTDKLYKNCLKTSVNEGRNVSVQDFQRWATTAAAEARALSQMLKQYADQADQAVTTLLP